MQVLKDQVRESILKSAAEEFYTKGYRLASMRRTANRAGVSLSNTYNYFKNKEKLFCEIAEPVYGRITGIMNEAVQMGNAVGGEGFREYADKLSMDLAKLSDESRKAIIILIEKSDGTRFEKTRDLLEKTLEEHFTAELGSGAYNYAYRLIAANFISGILGIIKGDGGTGESLKLYLKYHLSGITGLKQTKR